MNLKLKDYLFVGIQFILFFLYLFDIKIFNIDIPRFIQHIFLVITIFGVLILLLALLQLNTNLSPFPTPKSNSQLIQTGLYKYIRHPIYTGILVMLFGYGFYVNSAFKIVITLILLILFFFKSSYEEERLLSKYHNYIEYRKKTGRFSPKI